MNTNIMSYLSFSMETGLSFKAGGENVFLFHCIIIRTSHPEKKAHSHTLKLGVFYTIQIIVIILLMFVRFGFIKCLFFPPFQNPVPHHMQKLSHNNSIPEKHRVIAYKRSYSGFIQDTSLWLVGFEESTRKQSKRVEW